MSRNKPRGKQLQINTIPIRVSIALEWLPFVGNMAFSLYAFYSAMATAGIELGTRKIGRAMGVSYESVRRYTALLVHCQLIEVHTGNPTSPNLIDIIDPQELTPYLIEEIMDALHGDSLFAPLGKDGERQPTHTLKAIIKRAVAWQPVTAAPLASAPSANGNGYAASQIDAADLVARLQRVCNEHGSNKGAYFGGATAFVNDSPPALLIGWLDAIEANPSMVVKIDGVAGWIRNKVKNGEVPPVVKQQALLDPIPDEYKDIVLN